MCKLPTSTLCSPVSSEQFLQVHFSTRVNGDSGGVLRSLYCDRIRTYESKREGAHRNHSGLHSVF